MTQGNDPQGYGQQPPPGYHQGYPQQGYPPQYQQQPPKKKSRLWLWALIAIPGSCVALGTIGAVAGAGKAREATGTITAGTPAAPEAATESALDVQIGTLLSEYKDNEIRADGQFKGKRIRVGGSVDDVKKDILNNPFVTIGTGKQFEIPQVQCTLRSSEASKAANLSKGSSVTVTGKVGGLMMNVQLRDCVIE